MPRSARVVISDSRQQVVFGPSLIPLGYLPALTPFHHEADEMGSSVRTSLRRTSLSALSISVKGLLCNLKSFYLVKLSNIIYLYESLFQYITFLRRRRLSRRLSPWQPSRVQGVLCGVTTLPCRWSTRTPVR